MTLMNDNIVSWMGWRWAVGVIDKELKSYGRLLQNSAGLKLLLLGWFTMFFFYDFYLNGIIMLNSYVIIFSLNFYVVLNFYICQIVESLAYRQFISAIYVLREINLSKAM